MELRKLFAGVLAGLVLPLSGGVYASTRYISCTQQDDAGATQMIYATIDDDSDKAEVQMYLPGAECATDQSCDTDIYQKDVLPTVIRLTFSMTAGPVLYVTTIDIDRTNLNVSSRSSLKAPNGRSDRAFSGTCTMSVDQSKKLL